MLEESNTEHTRVKLTEQVSRAAYSVLLHSQRNQRVDSAAYRATYFLLLSKVRALKWQNTSVIASLSFLIYKLILSGPTSYVVSTVH